jgi:hypothetical protein
MLVSHVFSWFVILFVDMQGIDALWNLPSPFIKRSPMVFVSSLESLHKGFISSSSVK